MTASTETTERQTTGRPGAGDKVSIDAVSGARAVETDIPSRLDRLRWGRFHTLVVAALGIVLLNPHVIDPELGWRIAFLAGAVLGLFVFLMRFWIPESPRWLMIHGQPERAHAIVADIERGADVHPEVAAAAKLPIIRMRTHTPLCVACERKPLEHVARPLAALE